MVGVNLNSGEVNAIGAVGPEAGTGVPGYNCDDGAVVYMQDDAEAFLGVSLVRQAVGPDRLSPTGPATRWVSDGLFGVVYRRGPFTGPLPTATATVAPTGTAAATPTRTARLAPPSPTRTVAATRTPTRPRLVPPTRTMRPPPLPGECPGDCNRNRIVGLAELVLGAHFALEGAPLGRCLPIDAIGDGLVMVDELVLAVQAAVAGCGEP